MNPCTVTDSNWELDVTFVCYPFFMSNYRHGHMVDQIHATPTYQTWKSMKKRCESPRHDSYAHYGARGITVCERWKTFSNFLADMGVRPDGMTLDRIDVNGNYEPSNCRWATPEQQGANQRPHKDWKLDYATAQTIRARVNSGESRKAVAADLGVSYSQITKIMLGLRWPSATKESP